MPGFDGLTALKLYHEAKLDIPFILISGTIGEEIAVEAMRAGAHDYLMKDNLARLVPAIQRELHEAQIRRAHRQAQQELQRSNDLLRAIIEAAPTAIIGLDLDGNVQSVWNPAAEKMLGWSSEEALGRPLPSVPVESQEEFSRFRESIRSGETLDGVEVRRQRRDGSPIDYSINASPLRDTEGRITGNVAVLMDITERKRVQSIMQARLRLLEFAGSHSMDELLTAALDEIEALTGSTIGFYHFLESDQKTLSLQSWSTNTLKNMCTAEGKGRHYDVAQAGVWVDCIHERRPVIHNDYASLPHRKGLPDGHAHVNREVVVPIFRGSLIKAIIGMGNKSTPYDEGDIEIVSQLGDLSWDIAERKRAEEALKEQYSTLRGIIGSANALIFSVDRQYHYTSFNQGHAAVMKTLYGVEIEISQNMLDYMTVTEDRETARHNLDQALAGEQLVEEAYSGEEPRSRRYFQVSHSPIKTETGEIIGVAMLAQDMTERKRAEESLRESEKQFRLMAENSTDMISLHSSNGIYLYVSPACKTLLGYESDELVGHSAYEFFHPEDAAAVRQSHTTIIDQPVTYTVQYRIRRKDGSYIWFETTSRTIRDSQTGAVIEIQAASRDITERKRAEADLHKLSQAVEQSPVSIIVTDAAGNIEYVNPKFTQVTGYTQDEVIGNNPRILKSGETPPEEYGRLWNTITHGDVWQGEFHNKKKNGELYWESASISPVFDAQGNIEHFIAVKEDITERKQRERELEALVTVAMALRAALRCDEVLRIVADQLFDLLRTGGVALLLRSPEADELVVMAARGAWEHWIDVHLPLGEGISGQVVSTGQPFVSDDVRTDALLYRPDLIGDQHTVVCVPLIAKGEVIGVLWVGQQVPVGSQDVRLLKAVADMAATAIRRATLHEQAQRHAAELEERVAERTRELAEANTQLLELDQLKTQFVSNVSHELRTPITNLKLHLDLLMRGKPEKREHHVTVLKQQADRLAQLVEDILDLSRLELGSGEIAFAQVDLNHLVDQVVTAHQAVADHANLSLTFEPGSDLPSVRGEVNQLAQVVTNLVINALNYTPAGSVQVRTYLEDGHVCLAVEDTGPGIDPEDLPHLFERFYRGRSVSQGRIRGTGLGLAIVKEIVDLHKGSIEIDSQQGKGTTFTVRLIPL